MKRREMGRYDYGNDGAVGTEEDKKGRREGSEKMEMRKLWRKKEGEIKCKRRRGKYWASFRRIARKEEMKTQ